MARLAAVRKDMADRKTAVADAWKSFLAASNRPDSGPATLNQYEAEWRRFARWLAQTHPDVQSLAAVDDRHAEAYAGTLSAMAASTFNQHVGFLALLWRVLGAPANPWKGIRKKRRAATSRRELTLEELRAVCGAAQGELRVLLAMGVYTGMRLADCATLRWEEVDLARRMIRRVPVKTARRSGRSVSIPIHPALAAILTPGKRSGMVLPDLARSYNRDRGAVVDRIQKHFRACGIQTSRPRAGGRAVTLVGFHSLRHTFVSMCRAGGAPLAVVEELVGHSSPAMTRHYTHTGDEAAAAAVGLLPVNIVGPNVERIDDISGKIKKRP